jgi:hypothetical protein
MLFPALTITRQTAERGLDIFEESPSPHEVSRGAVLKRQEKRVTPNQPPRGVEVLDVPPFSSLDSSRLSREIETAASPLRWRSLTSLLPLGRRAPSRSGALAREVDPRQSTKQRIATGAHACLAILLMASFRLVVLKSGLEARPARINVSGSESA